ncbi:MAG: RNA methyltransferase [Actinomycetota bacterium]|nr:RNA methyltransferase [Actinomycetota bacterium]
MPGEVITSKANPLVKRARRLKQRKYRDKEGAFLIEGIHLVWTAIENDVPIETLLFCPGLLTSERASALVDAHEKMGLQVTLLSEEAYGAFSERQNPAGLAAIARATPSSLEELTVEEDSVFVVLDRVGNPGNLGTILRTLDAVGGSAAILVGETCDPYHPAAVKASMGALFAHPVVTVQSFGLVEEWARDNGVFSITTSAHAATDYWDADYRGPIGLVLGSEAEGLPKEVRDAGDQSVRIPMEGNVTSLNLAVAAGILLYEVKRSRGS